MTVIINGTTGIDKVQPSASSGQVLELNGIKFPATQVASANANTLDDYEEGTWTPTFGFNTPNSAGVTYGTPLGGYYTKVGNVVTISFVLAVTNKGSATGNGVMGGFPFPCINNAAARGGIAIGYTSNLTVNNPNIMLDAGGTEAVFRTPNGSDMSNTTFGTSFAVYGSCSYLTA